MKIVPYFLRSIPTAFLYTMQIKSMAWAKIQLATSLNTLVYKIDLHKNKLIHKNVGTIP